MRRTRALFQFDPGWLYLLAGLVICGAGILVPATDGLGHLETQVTGLRSVEHHLLDRVGAYEEFLDAVDRQDPVLIRRLAATQLNLMPEGDVPVLLCASNSASVIEWIEARVPPRSATPALVEPPQTLLRRLASGPHQLWFIGAGVFCVFLGLIIGGPAPTASGTIQAAARPAAPVAVPQPIIAAAAVSPVVAAAVVDEPDDHPAQLALFEDGPKELTEDLVEVVFEDEAEPADEVVPHDEHADEADEPRVEDTEDDEDVDEDEEDVDEDGNPVDADDVEDENADEVEYEYEYVDEDGNPVDADDVEDEDEEDVEYEYVDEDGNPVDADDVEDDDVEDVEYEYEYVDEDGNPIAPEDVDEEELEEEEVRPSLR